MKSAFIYSILLLTTSVCFSQDTVDKVTPSTLLLEFGNWKYTFHKTSFEDHNPRYDKHGNFMIDTVVYDPGIWHCEKKIEEVIIDGDLPPFQSFESYPEDINDSMFRKGYEFDSIYFPKHISVSILDTITLKHLNQFAHDFLSIEFFKDGRGAGNLFSATVTIVYPNRKVKQYHVYPWSTLFIDKLNSLEPGSYVLLENKEIEFSSFSSFGWLIL